MAEQGTRLVFSTTGRPEEVLELESFALHSPLEGEVEVRMAAAPINPADLNTLEGTYGVKLELPATPGIEGYGHVRRSGSPDFKEGDPVMFLKRSATWATHTYVAADTLFKLPPGMDPFQAAMLKVNPATAWQLLHGFSKLKQGDSIVQNVGNSAVGRCVIQLAHEMGVRSVSFVRRSELINELKALGADAVFIDDENGRSAAKEWLGGSEASLAFNAVGGDSALGLLKLLKEGASHITYGAMGRRPVTVPNGLLIFKDITVRGLWVTKWIDRASSDEITTVYTALAERVKSGNIIQKVDSHFTLTDFHEALSRLDDPSRDGKILFSF